MRLPSTIRLITSAVVLLQLGSCSSTQVHGRSNERTSTRGSDTRGPESRVENEVQESVSGEITRYRIPGSAISFEMIAVSGGEFKLGSPDSTDGADEDEIPQVDVTVDTFQIGRYEVTHDEYVLFRYAGRDSDSTAVEGRRMDVDAIARPSTPYEDPAHGMSGPGFPAVGMTQWGALHYAKWLSEKTGEFFRLPTETEWELACKAGGNGDLDESALQEVSWYKSNSGAELKKVGTRTADALGIHDMLGNAAEWTLDQYDKSFYTSIESTEGLNPWRRPDRLHPRTVRGGAYNDGSSEVRCTARMESNLNWKRRDPQIPKSFWWNTDSPFVGFRLVRPLNQPSADEQAAFWQLVLRE
ncbi:MAG: formylglycine-generating enzyme family protein [Rhodothermia bacterium]|nr:MAG: formylglycine-generating enzyme family protein [Rhodothermia bacterium]